MKLTLSSVVAAPRERVFAALVDPAILQQCIPGCESLVEVSPDVFEATLKIGIAGLKGTYKGKATIRDRQPPASLTLSFEGKGGPGWVRGTSAIGLSSDDAATRVASDAEVQVGGLIAAVGSRLVEAAAKKLASDFFTELGAQLARSEGSVGPKGSVGPMGP
ncbi:MAG TPA: carbon monoxide dehydrogenase subunit G [Vicinamibacterales bacterium]|nr:carbon monoxide dehydrogenase subunit G [Vicinamibacterales bacterium]